MAAEHEPEWPTEMPHLAELPTIKQMLDEADAQIEKMALTDLASVASHTDSGHELLHVLERLGVDPLDESVWAGFVGACACLRSMPGQGPRAAASALMGTLATLRRQGREICPANMTHGTYL